jgi:hypothetical protein
MSVMPKPQTAAAQTLLRSARRFKRLIQIFRRRAARTAAIDAAVSIVRTDHDRPAEAGAGKRIFKVPF